MKTKIPMNFPNIGRIDYVCKDFLLYRIHRKRWLETVLTSPSKQAGNQNNTPSGKDEISVTEQTQKQGPIKRLPNLQMLTDAFLSMLPYPRQ